MSSVAQIEEVDALSPEPRPEPGKSHGKAAFTSFACLVTMGLALGCWYVGDRILAAGRVRPNDPPAASQPAEPAKPQAQQPVVDKSPQELLPLALEYYLEIAALGTAEDANYVAHLRANGFAARMETASDEKVGRILIGPYSSTRDFRRAQRKLTGAGVLAREIVR